MKQSATSIKSEELRKKDTFINLFPTTNNDKTTTFLLDKNALRNFPLRILLFILFPFKQLIVLTRKNKQRNSVSYVSVIDCTNKSIYFNEIEWKNDRMNRVENTIDNR